MNGIDAAGAYGVPFIGMACLYAIATLLFWVFFRNHEAPTADTAMPAIVTVEPAEAPVSG